MNRAQEVLIYITAYHQEQNAEGRKGGFNYWFDLDDINVLKNHVEHPHICVSQKEKHIGLAPMSFEMKIKPPFGGGF